MIPTRDIKIAHCLYYTLVPPCYMQFIPFGLMFNQKMWINIKVLTYTGVKQQKRGYSSAKLLVWTAGCFYCGAATESAGVFADKARQGHTSEASTSICWMNRNIQVHQNNDHIDYITHMQKNMRVFQFSTHRFLFNLRWSVEKTFHGLSTPTLTCCILRRHWYKL